MEKKRDNHFHPMSMSPPYKGRNGTKLRLCNYKFAPVWLTLACFKLVKYILHTCLKVNIQNSADNSLIVHLRMREQTGNIKTKTTLATFRKKILHLDIKITMLC